MRKRKLKASINIVTGRHDSGKISHDNGRKPRKNEEKKRLWRLGVRQAEDQRAATPVTPDTAARLDSVKVNHQMGIIHQFGQAQTGCLVSPSSRQLKRIMDSQVRFYSNNSLRNINKVGNAMPLQVLRPQLRCLDCHKHFLSYFGYDIHLEKHPNRSVRCMKCNIRFISNKSLVMHQRLRHSGKEIIVSAGIGFHHLNFTDFSSDKFPLVCQYLCEVAPSKAASVFHDFTCLECGKSFPMEVALNRHISQQHYKPSKFICKQCNHDFSTKEAMDAHRQQYNESIKKRLNSDKRNHLHALSLLPLCGIQSFQPVVYTPAVNSSYFQKLHGIETSTRAFYASDPLY